MKPSKQGPEATQFHKGQSGNPGGLTSDEREARDAVRQALAGHLRAKGLAAYERLLDADNPLIVKDFMDRLAGKVKERVELSGDPDSPLTTGLPSDMLTDFANWRVERREKELLQSAQPVK